MNVQPQICFNIPAQPVKEILRHCFGKTYPLKNMHVRITYSFENLIDVGVEGSEKLLTRLVYCSSEQRYHILQRCEQILVASKHCVNVALWSIWAIGKVKDIRAIYAQFRD